MRNLSIPIIIILSVFAAFPQVLSAQKKDKKPPLPELQTDSTSGKFMYSKVVMLDSVDKGVLYDRAKTWVARNYRSANAVIQYDDKEVGKIIVKGYWKELASDVELWHTLILEFKNNKYRYIFTDFVKTSFVSGVGKMEESIDGSMMFKKLWKNTFRDRSVDFGEDLEKSIKTADKDSGW